MDLDEEFRKELKVLLASNKNPNKKRKKNKTVSWEVNEEDHERKGTLRSTPFPKKKKSREVGKNLKSTTLFFEFDSKSKENDKSNTSSNKKGNERTESDKCIKGKLKSKSLHNRTSTQSTSNGWMEINISSPSQEDSDDSFTPKFDSDGQLANEILMKLKQKNVSAQNEVPDTFTENNYPEVDQIEVLARSFQGYFSGSEFDSSTSDDNFEISKVLKAPKRFKKQCTINLPNFKITVPPIVKVLSDKKKKLNKKLMKKNEVKMKKIKNKLKKHRNKHTQVEEIPKQYEERKSDLQINSVESVSLIENISDNFNNTMETSDMEFLQDSFYTEKTKESTEVPTSTESSDSIKFYLSKNYSVFVLKHPSKLYFCGKLSVTILSGAVKIFGHIFEDDTKDLDVYSPKHMSYTCFETVEKETNDNLSKILQDHEMDKSVVENIRCPFSIIALKNIENNMISCLENFMPRTLFPKICQVYENRFLSLPELGLQCYFEMQYSKSQVFNVSDEWKEIIEPIKMGSDHVRLMVCGGKDVGKSSFLKFAVNELLNSKEKVIYIDLDPGQPEFTIPGCVSVSSVEEPLLGPNYTHLRKTLRCHFIGDVNIAQCLNRYLEAVKNLLTYCNEHLEKSTWLINYMGFTKSLGTDIIASVIKIVCPTLLVQIQSENSKLNFDSVLTPNFIKKHNKFSLIDLSSANINYEVKLLRSLSYSKDGKRGIEPKFLRELCVVSYFSRMLTEENCELSTVHPFCVSLSSVKLSHINEAMEDLPAILNANIVALCEDSTGNCLGFGIVRGIDLISNKLYLITPEHESVMQKVDSLVMGVIMPPVTFYKTVGKHDGAIPYVSISTKQATTVVPKRSYRACQYLLKKE